MIPLAIAIGIIEDKIANDLTSKDTKARECLEDVKAKISRHKSKQYLVKMQVKDFGMVECIVDDLEVKDGFIIATNNGYKTYRNKDTVEFLNVMDADTEDDYVEGTTRGLVDL